MKLHGKHPQENCSSFLQQAEMVMRKKREGCSCICDAYLTKFQPKGSYSLFLLYSVYFITACLDELGRETKHLDFQVRDHHNVKRENSKE